MILYPHTESVEENGNQYASWEYIAFYADLDTMLDFAKAAWKIVNSFNLISVR